jgi:hypothetical protein
MFVWALFLTAMSISHAQRFRLRQNDTFFAQITESGLSPTACSAASSAGLDNFVLKTGCKAAKTNCALAGFGSTSQIWFTGPCVFNVSLPKKLGQTDLFSTSLFGPVPGLNGTLSGTVGQMALIIPSSFIFRITHCNKEECGPYGFSTSQSGCGADCVDCKGNNTVSVYSTDDSGCYVMGASLEDQDNAKGIWTLGRGLPPTQPTECSFLSKASVSIK